MIGIAKQTLIDALEIRDVSHDKGFLRAHWEVPSLDYRYPFWMTRQLPDSLLTNQSFK